MFIELFEQIEDLSSAITQSEIFHEYVDSKNKLNQDKEAQKLIKSFVVLKEQFEEVERFGKYHPDYDSVKKKMREKKRELDFHATIARFKKAERELDNLLYEISKIIAHTVSDSIKVPTGNPFLDSRSCSCSAGGSCHCSNIARI